MAENDEDSRLERAAMEAIRIGGREQLRGRMQRFEADWEKGKKGGIIRGLWKQPRFWLAMAAAVFALIVMRQMLWSPPTTQELFAEYFEPYRGPVNIRGEAAADIRWQSAVASYNEADYETAARRFETALEADDPRLDYLIYFYQGISYLAMESIQPQLAIDALSQVLNSDNNYVEQARWHLALAYLADENETQAREILEEIVVDKAYRWEEAEEIVDGFR